MTTIPPQSPPPTPRERVAPPGYKHIAWQGLTVSVPEDWDLTGFSGTFDEGYVRIDDGEDQGLELKWATEPKRSQKVPDVEVRAEAYLLSLQRAAKKKRIAFDGSLAKVPSGVQREGRVAAGFRWVGDRTAQGVVWHCVASRRTVIAQVLGEGKKGLSALAEKVLGSIESLDAEVGWRRWALYDLDIVLPSRFQLVSQQLMNVYLRLTLADGTERLSVEQWAVANVARRDSYLDLWIESNAKGELRQARFSTTESQMNGHAAIELQGGLGFGQPWIQAVRDLFSLRLPATRFTGRAWHCEPVNKIYLIQALRCARSADPLPGVLKRFACHAEGAE